MDLLEQKIVDIYSQGVSDIVIMGDANINLADVCNANSKKYRNILNTLHLSQIINDPTRITANSRTLIDHILVNRSEMFYQAGTLDVAISDHHMVYTARKKLKIPKSFDYIKCRSYTNLDELALQHDVERIDWSVVLSDRNIESAASNFHTLLTECVDRHAPMINVKLHDNALKWFTHDYLSHINEREYCRRKYNICPCPEHDRLRLDSRRRTKELRMSLQRSYFDDALRNATTVKKKWQIIKEFWPHLSKKTKN